MLFAVLLQNRFFPIPLQYRITKNRSRLLRTDPPAYLLRPGVHFCFVE